MLFGVSYFVFGVLGVLANRITKKIFYHENTKGGKHEKKI